LSAFSATHPVGGLRARVCVSARHRSFANLPRDTDGAIAMNEAEKREITQKFSAEMSARDIDLLKSIMTDDVVWSLPGNSLMSGEAHGVEAVLKRAETMHRHGVNVGIEHVVFGLKDVAQHLH